MLIMYTKLHQLDRKILAELDKNSRRSFGEIGRAIGVSAHVIKYRFENLVKRGIIIGTPAFVNYSKLGFYDRLSVTLRTVLISRKKENEMLEFLRSKNLDFVGTFEGDWHIAFAAFVKSTSEFKKFFDEFLQKYEDYVVDYFFYISEKRIQFNRKYLNPNEILMWCVKDNSPKIALNEIDISIVELLKKNCRINNKTISEKLGISRKTVAKKISELEKKGVIVHYGLVLNPTMLGMQTYSIWIKSNRKYREKDSKFFEFCAANLHIIQFNKGFGLTDYTLVFESPSLDSLTAFTDQLTKEFPKYIQSYKLLVYSKRFGGITQFER